MGDLEYMCSPARVSDITCEWAKKLLILQGMEDDRMLNRRQESMTVRRYRIKFVINGNFTPISVTVSFQSISAHFLIQYMRHKGHLNIELNILSLEQPEVCGTAI